MVSVQPNVMSHKQRSRVLVTQTSPFALATGDGSARDQDSTEIGVLEERDEGPPPFGESDLASRQENLTANRAGDRRSTAPPLPPDIALAYRVNDAAKVAGLSRSSLYLLIGEGKLRSIRVAGRRLIPADALRDLLRGAA